MTKVMILLVVLALVGCGHTTTTRCTEDMSCWNCETMGNHICGGK